jgi:hypothetical protein
VLRARILLRTKHSAEEQERDTPNNHVKNPNRTTHED